MPDWQRRGTVADGVRIRRADACDDGAIRALMTDCFGSETVLGNDAFWSWKHEANPFGPSPVLVAEDAGRLVGLRAFMRWTWRSGGVAAPAVRAVDTVTHPEYRGRGLFTRLTLQLRDEMEAEGVSFVFNTPNAKSRPGYLKMGWALVGEPALWVRPVRPVRLALALRREGLGGEEGEAPPVEASPSAEVLYGTGVEALVEAAAAVRPWRLHTPLSPGYLRWRYADVVRFHYQALSRGEGADGALVVLRARRRGTLRELRVCEVVVGPTPAARRNARRLLREAQRRADVDVVLAMPGGSPAVSRILLAAGFVPVPRTGPQLTTYPFPAAASVPDPRRLANWAVSIGDLEVF